MKILQVQNHPRGGGGADEVFRATVSLLKKKGMEVNVLSRSSAELGAGLSGKLRAFLAGIYSYSAYRLMEQIIQNDRPDVVHVHDLYPFLPWVLPACRQAGVPVVMTCHNYRLICPALLFLNRGRVCKNCLGGREYWCIIKNCRGNPLENIAFVLHNVIARKIRLFHDNITLFISPSEFTKSCLVEAGFNDDRIIVLPNMVSIPERSVDASCGQYVAYVGRISPEKGISTLIASAQQTGYPIHIAGGNSPNNEAITTRLATVKFKGLLNRKQLDGFYRDARFSIVPSVCFEVFGLVAAEAMSYGLPVIAANIGGLQEIVDDGVTGFHFEPGNANDLAQKMRILWENNELCRQMGRNGRAKAKLEYAEEVHYERLMSIYEETIKMSKYHTPVNIF